MKNNDNGRSMIEMLGVLAVIGILSAGALGGYSKAMLQYKLNQQIDQIHQLISGITKYQNDLYGLPRQEIFDILNGVNEIPHSMMSTNTTDLHDIFQNRITMYTNNTTIFILSIFLEGIKNGNLAAMRECQNIIKVAQNWSSEIYYIQTLSAYGANNESSRMSYGNLYCTNGSNCLKDLTTQQINQICLAHSGNDAAYMELKIRWKK